MNNTLSSIIVGTLQEISNYFITFIAGLSVVVFIFGVTKYIWKGDSETEREKGKKLMIWGVIGIFVLFGVWGLVGLLGGTFGVDTVIPQFKAN